MARWRERVRLEDGLKLDLNKLLRDGIGKTGERRWRSIQWNYVGTGEVIASGSLEMDLSYDEDAGAALRLGRLEQFIQLQREPRRFGEGQWYCICPSTGLLASVFWLPRFASRFASRQTWGKRVAFGSQFQAPLDRALTRARDIRTRLGGREYASLIGRLTPPKPKGMRWRTYDRVISKSEAHEKTSNFHLTSFLARLERYER
jgi:hypothetical protein